MGEVRGPFKAKSSLEVSKGRRQLLVRPQNLPETSATFQSGKTKLAGPFVRVLGKRDSANDFRHIDDARIQAADIVPIIVGFDLAGTKREYAFCFKRISLRDPHEIIFRIATFSDDRSKTVICGILLNPSYARFTPNARLSELRSTSSRDSRRNANMGDFGRLKEIRCRLVVEKQSVRVKGLKPSIIKASSMIGAECRVPLIKLVRFQIPPRGGNVAPRFLPLSTPLFHILGPVQTDEFCLIALKSEKAVPIRTELLLSRLWVQLYVNH